MAAGRDAGSDDDVFDETAEPSRIAELEWQRLSDSCVKIGLGDGLAEGKEKALQAGFDQGFREGFQLVRNVSLWRGLVRGVCSFAEEKAPLTELCQRLEALERDLLSGQASAERVSEARAHVVEALQAHQLPQLCDALDDA